MLNENKKIVIDPQTKESNLIKLEELNIKTASNISKGSGKEIDLINYVDLNKKRRFLKPVASDKREKKLIDRGTIFISTLSLIVSLFALYISYGQNKIGQNQTQVASSQLELEERQFDISKTPNFSVFVEEEPLYTEDEEWNLYCNWLHQQNIEDYFSWQYQNWKDNKLPDYQFDAYEYFSEEDSEKITLDEKTIFIYNRYVQDPNVEKFVKPGIIINVDVFNFKTFWFFCNEYMETRDPNELNELTKGEYEEYADDYHKYLSENNFTDFSAWKKKYNFKQQTIELKNISAPISNATLEVYIFAYCDFSADEYKYRLGLETNDYYLEEFRTGSFTSRSYNYDTGSSSFILEYDLYPNSYEEQRLIIKNLLKDLQDEFCKFKTDDMQAILFSGTNIYFKISYLDAEGMNRNSLYIYNPNEKMLSIVNANESSIEEPNVHISNDFFVERCSYIGQIIGFDNSFYISMNNKNDNSIHTDYLKSMKQTVIDDFAKLFEDT